jgi:hypothetical protein
MAEPARCLGGRLLLHRWSASLPVFRSLPRAGHFLLRAQEKVTKEKGTPQTCPPGLLPCGSVGRRRGSSTAPPVLTTNARASLPAPLRAFRPRPTTSDGTRERASCAQKIKQQPKRRRVRPAPALSLLLSIKVLLSSAIARPCTDSRFFASRSCTCLSAQDARQRGPCAAAKVRRKRPEGWATGRGPVRCRRRRRRQRTPGAPSRSRRAGCPETAVPGWPFFWLLFFGHAKKSDPLAWRRAENRQGRRPPTKQHPTNIVTQAERAGRRPRGPCAAAKVRREKPEGWATGRGPVRCRRRRRRQRTPPERLREVVGQDARRPRYRGGLSFGYFS